MTDEAPVQKPEEEAGPTRGRKRTRDPNSWKRNINKRSRNSGEAYSTKKGQPVLPKTFPVDYDCQCTQRCNGKFPSEEGKKIFDSFWKLGDYSKQNVFLRGLVKVHETVRSRPRDGSGVPKTCSYSYIFSNNTKSVQVCKKYFLNILQISWGRLYRCLSKEEVFAVMDSRGKRTPGNKLDISGIVEHIQSFPAYQSHYTRQHNPERKYLHPDLSIRKMYQLYVEKCETENKAPLKEKLYYKTFSTKFNLHFKTPSKDTCRLCDDLNMKIQAEDDANKKQGIKVQKELHLRKAELARTCLNADKEKVSDDIYTCTFDLQKALPFPKISTSVAYYKRNLYVYNLGVHSFNSGEASMYMWDETEGGRGSQDISAVVVKHIKKHAANHKHIILYSDSCGGQNRNIKMALSLLKVLHSEEISAETIDFKFLVSGHSFLPNDADFGVIESASKKVQHIYVPSDWSNIVKAAKRKVPKFNVVEMKREEFLSTLSLEEAITNRKKSTNGENFSWLNIRWLRFIRGSPISLYFKETMNEEMEFTEVNLRKATKGRPLQSLASIDQTVLYPVRRVITAAKKRDMYDLLPYIPPIHHAFFRNLPVELTTRSQNSAGNQGDDEEADEVVYDEET